MKNTALIFNAVLLVLVGVLFYLHFSSNGKVASMAHKKDSSTTAPNDHCRIAYFEMDSVTNSFAMVKDVKSDLSKEEDKMNNEMARLQKVYNDKLAQYQHLASQSQMTQVQSEQANREMLQLQETIRGQKQDMDQKYQDLYMRKMQDVKTKKCTITETKPTSTEVTVVNGDSVYKTKTEAESGMKTIKVCTSN